VGVPFAKRAVFENSTFLTSLPPVVIVVLWSSGIGMQQVIGLNISTLPHTVSSAKQMIAIRLVSPMSTRPRRFCLALQDDSVFADFGVDL
jgi:hypothetical protein